MRLEVGGGGRVAVDGRGRCVSRCACHGGEARVCRSSEMAEEKQTIRAKDEHISDPEAAIIIFCAGYCCASAGDRDDASVTERVGSHDDSCESFLLAG